MEGATISEVSCLGFTLKEDYSLVISILLTEELRLEDGESFRNVLRMEPTMFDELLNRIRPRIANQDTWYRQAIDPGLK